MQHSVLQGKTPCDSAKTTVYIASNHSEESLISSSDEEHVDLLLGKNKRIVGSLFQFYMLGTEKN